MKRTIIAVLLLLAFAPDVTGQGLTPPSEGKAVIYFARITDLGFAIPFQFFHGEKFIGEFAGRKYMRYECDPGEHLFWASSENKEFLTAEVVANSIYVVIVDVKMGIGIARVGLTPIDRDSELLVRVKKLVDKKEPAVTPKSTIDAKSVKLADFIREKLKKYEETWQHEKKFNHLSGDMTIPADPQVTATPVSN
jgi:hypothetical protein